MHDDRTGQTAVIFLSQRSAGDDAAYAEASAAMETLAAAQPGYRGIDGVRGADGFGITVSWWSDDAAACAWRQHVEHARTRGEGRARWYDRYQVCVATIGRSYGWTR